MNNLIGLANKYLATYGPTVLTAVLILVIGVWIARIASKLTQRAMLKAKVSNTLSVFIGNTVYYAIVFFVVLSFLEKIGVKTTSFLAIVGAAGLAFALALQG